MTALNCKYLIKALKASRLFVNPAFSVAVLLIFSMALQACVASFKTGHAQGPKTYKILLSERFDDYRRSYLLHIPEGYAPETARPLVVVIHGAFDTAKGMEKVSGFRQLADRENFAVLYPEGIGIMGFLQHWNAGHCCGKAAEDGWDDVGFVAAAIQDASARIKIDPARIYMVGFSNGGMLTHRFAAERGDLLAAAAPMAASIGGRPSGDAPEWHIPKPNAPVSIIAFHGGDDDEVPFEGGISPNHNNTRSYWSVERSMQFWALENGCAVKRTDEGMLEGYVQVTSWTGCQKKKEVVLYVLKNWGHIWPGRYFTGSLKETHPLKNFDAAEIIWEFFKKHPVRAESNSNQTVNK